MGKCIGLDFGTTYSVIAELADPENGDFTPRTASIKTQDSKKGDNYNYYDSIVLRINDSLYCADKAWTKLGRGDDYISYSGFKLLLAEKEDSELLKNYDEKYMPSTIVKEYLQYLLESYKYMSEENENIDRIVIGVPDVWMYEKQNGCYEKLRSIVEEMHIATRVDFLSEPEAAAAYWADNYKKNNNDIGYEGDLLLIDYGGGTLDICISTIKDVDGSPEIDIDPKKQSGAGYNTDKKIGKAGQAFMKEVIKLALEEAGISEQEFELYNRTGLIDQGVYDLERELKDLSARIDAYKNKYEKNRINEKEKGLNDKDKKIERFITQFKGIDKNKLEGMVRRKDRVANEPVFDEPIIIKGAKYEITYNMVARAYSEVIYPELDKCMKKVMQFIPEHSFSSDTFRVQLIGGFSNFYLVEEQIKRALDPITSANEKYDQRFLNGIPRGEGRTCAVAYGTALKANERVIFLSKWKYNIGLKGTMDKEFFWAVQIGDELVEDKIYLMKKNGSKKAAHILMKNVEKLYFLGIMDKIEDASGVSIDDTVTLDGGSSVGYVMGVSTNPHKTITFYWWKLKQDIDRRKIDKRLEEFEEEINTSRDIVEFDMHKSGKIEIDKLVNND